MVGMCIPATPYMQPRCVVKGLRFDARFYFGSITGTVSAPQRYEIANGWKFRLAQGGPPRRLAKFTQASP